MGEVGDSTPTFLTDSAVYPIGIFGFLPGKSNRGVKLATNLHLMPRLGMSGTMLLPPPMPNVQGEGQQHLTLVLMLLIVTIQFISLLLMCWPIGQLQKQ